MKIKIVLLCVLIAIVAGTAGGFVARHSRSGTKPAESGARKVLYYQSPMHPWITSDKPGRCTICGMKMEPVYEGRHGFAAGDGLVTLDSNSIQVIHVQSEVVTNRPLMKTLRVAGTVEDNDTKHRRLSVYADGRIEKLFVNFVGAEVVAGQPLAQFYSPALLAAEGEYLTVASQSSGDGLSANLQEERKRLLTAAAERLRRLGYSDAQIAALKGNGTNLARTEILAPMSGIVVARNVYEGQYVKEGDLLFELADFGTMWFQFDAYERDLSWLKAGQNVEITSSTLPGKVLRAPITFIDPNLNEMTRSAKVRVELPNPIVKEDGLPQRILFHRMYADGVVKIRSPEVLAVPRSAVLFADRPVAYVDLGGGAYEPRQVKLGRLGDDYWEVLAGVSAGERVVTTGNLLLDAQAQLNTSMHQPGEKTSAPSQTNAATAPPAVALQTAANFLAASGAVSEALAADSLSGFDTRAEKVHEMLPALLAALEIHPAWRPLLKAIEESGHFEHAATLDAARRQFVPFSAAVSALAERMRQPGAIPVKIYECPMTDRAVAGAPKRVRWIQNEEPIRNPFFGGKMLDCGSEVKP